MSFPQVHETAQPAAHRADVIQPVDIDEIAIVEFPAFTPVRDERAGKQVWVNGLGIASAQPGRGNIRSGAQRERGDFHARCLGAVPGSEPATSGLKGVTINWATG